MASGTGHNNSGCRTHQAISCYLNCCMQQLHVKMLHCLYARSGHHVGPCRHGCRQDDQWATWNPIQYNSLMCELPVAVVWFQGAEVPKGPTFLCLFHGRRLGGGAVPRGRCQKPYQADDAQVKPVTAVHSCFILAEAPKREACLWSL